MRKLPRGGVMRRSMIVLAAFGVACGQYTAKATVTVAVSGPGAVRSSALQGDCRGTCWFSVSRSAPVRLEAIVDGQSSFAGWSGACSGTGACDLAPGADVSVAATFTSAPPPQPRRLQVSLNGVGAVRSDPAGIDCPQTCAADFPDGTAVRLDATASAGWDFNGFGGACSGPSCTVTLSSNMSAWATFQQRPVTISVQMSGSGSVVSNPAGIDCPRICSTAFAAGTSLTLTPSSGTGFSFSGFSGACTGASCALQLSSDAQVSAAFSAIPLFNLTVVTGGSGVGKVTSSPPGIDCPGTCSASFFQGTSVALSAAPDVLSKFGRWSGSCSGASCSLVLSADAAVAAEFQQQRYVVMDLGTLPQGYWTMPSAISPHALLITGTSGQAFFWDGAMHSLGLVNGGPTAVNDSGIVVGGYYPGNPGSAQAFRWERGTTTNLPTLGGLTSWATSINRDGVVAGWADRADGFSRAVYWTSKGPVDLGSLGGAWSACSTAWGINSAGIVVGTSCVANSGTHAVRFRGPGEIDDLGTFGGYSATARAINDAGVIVGVASYADATTHGFVYADGKATDVGALPGTRYSQLVAINGSGVAVGSSSDGGNGRGVVYGAGRMMDLNSLVERSPFTIIGASGIDEAGNIVAQGLDLGSSRAVLLRPH